MYIHKAITMVNYNHDLGSIFLQRKWMEDITHFNREDQYDDVHMYVRSRTYHITSEESSLICDGVNCRADQ